MTTKSNFQFSIFDKTKKQKSDLVNKLTSGSVNQGSRNMPIRTVSAGQASIVFLIISAIALTLGLVSTRNVTVDTKIDTNTIEKNEATNVAESAIETYLGLKVDSRGSSFGYTGTTGVGASVTSSSLVSTESGGYHSLIFDRIVKDGEMENYWLMGHNDDGSLDVGTTYGGGDLSLCVDNGFVGSLQADIYYKTTNTHTGVVTTKVQRVGGDFGSTTLFGPVAPGSNCVDGSNRKMLTVAIPAIPSYLVVARVLNGQTKLELIGDAQFPSQGFNLTSQGVAGQSKSTIRTQLRWGIPIDEFMLFGVSGANIK